MNREELEARLKRAMIKDLRLEGFCIDDLSPVMPLFGQEGLKLDSLDAVELVTTVEREFGVTIPNADEAHKAFATLGSLVDYIEAHQTRTHSHSA